MRRIFITIFIAMHFISCAITGSNKSEKISSPPLQGITPQPIITTTTTTSESISKLITTTSQPPKKLLGYIFDSHLNNKHHHHDHRWGPHFEDTLNSTNITERVGSTAVLHCRISLLQDKTVSWVKRKNSNELELLTVGLHTYTGDSRYKIEFQYPNNWRLQIKDLNKGDEGIYECQISTHPPRVIRVFLRIKAPEVMIVDENEKRLYEKYYKADSTIQLRCLVRHVAMMNSYVLWIHENNTLNYDLTRGGISVKTDLLEEGANSSLAIARAEKSDSGNYTCSISPTEYATVAVHVLNGENPAELHHGSSAKRNILNNNINIMLLMLIIIIAVYR